PAPLLIANAPFSPMAPPTRSRTAASSRRVIRGTGVRMRDTRPSRLFWPRNAPHHLTMPTSETAAHRVHRELNADKCVAEPVKAIALIRLHADRSPFRPRPTTCAGPRPPQLSRFRFNLSISVSFLEEIGEASRSFAVCPKLHGFIPSAHGRTMTLLL